MRRGVAFFVVAAAVSVGSVAGSATPAAAETCWWQPVGGIAVSEPSMSALSPINMSVQVVGADNGYWRNHFLVIPGGGWWGPWSPLANGGLLSPPEPDGPPVFVERITAGTPRTDAFFIDGTGTLWHRWRTTGARSPPEDLGDGFFGTPAVASWAPGRFDVFATDFETGELLHIWYSDATGWSPREHLGGILVDSPTVTSWAPGRLDIFGTGIDGAVWHKYWNHGWSGWESLGGITPGHPAATSRGPGLLDIVVAGIDRALYHMTWDGGRWSGWTHHGGILTSSPAAAALTPGRLDIAVVGVDDAVWHQTCTF
jgi:hypothetical protein